MTRMFKTAAAAMVLLPLIVRIPSIEPAEAAQTTAAPKLTFAGEVALWTVAIRPDKAADFEQIMTKLQQGLLKSDKPHRRQQAVGWRIVKIDRPLPDGNVAYVHLINPVVAEADYTVMQILYDEFPDERQGLYERYRAAFAQNLSLASGSVLLDMSKAH